MAYQKGDLEDSEELSQDEEQVGHQSIAFQQEQLEITQYDASHAQVDKICTELEFIIQQVTEIADQLGALKEKTYKSIGEAKLEVMKMD